MDGRAEHVQEQQREHDRLDGDVAQPFRDPGDGAQAPADEQAGLAEVADEPPGPRRQGSGDALGAASGRGSDAGHDAASVRASSVGVLVAGGWPVSARKASSRVGRRRAISSIGIPLERTAAATLARASISSGAGTDMVRRSREMLMPNAPVRAATRASRPWWSTATTSTRWSPMRALR